MKNQSPEKIAQWCGGEWTGGLPAKIDGVCHDSRAVRPENLYFAIKGERFDGHNYIREAARAGAAGAVVCRTEVGKKRGGLPLLMVDDTRRALTDIAAGYRNELPGLIIAISGSVGKTTVKEMLADILGKCGTVAKTRGNWNNDLGLPLSLLSMSPDDSYGVFEIGINHPGEMRPLVSMLKPRWGILTAIGAAHIEFFVSVESIAHEKAVLFDALPQDGLAFMDCDLPWYETIRAHVPCRPVTVSLKDSSADLTGRPKERDLLELTSVRTGRQFECRMSLPGEHMVRDAMLAVAVALELGVDTCDIQDSLAHYEPLSMRWTREDVNGVGFINDAYNANPLSMRASLDTFEALDVDGKKWLILGGMRELGRTAHAEHIGLGRYVAKGSWDGVIAVGSLGMWLADGVLEEGFPAERIVRCPDHVEAVSALIDFGVSCGDAVLLKASRGEKLEKTITCFDECFAH